MFKKTKGGSSFKSGKVSSGASGKKDLLEEVGYVFDSASRKSGWTWSTEDASSTENQPTEQDAIADAWRDAGQRTQALMEIPAATWEAMSDREQSELLRDALSTG
jgi:hypothetical protein